MIKNLIGFILCILLMFTPAVLATTTGNERQSQPKLPSNRFLFPQPLLSQTCAMAGSCNGAMPTAAWGILSWRNRLGILMRTVLMRSLWVDTKIQGCATSSRTMPHNTHISRSMRGMYPAVRIIFQLVHV